jgi:hypothetical protein
MEQYCSGHGDVICAPRPGVCISFADPHETALEADVFWRVEDYLRIISAYVRSSGDPGFGSIVSLGQARCRKSLLKTKDGEQHLLLRDRGRLAQVRCVGADIRVEPFALELVVDEFPNVERRQRLTKRFADIYRNRSFGLPKDGWTAESMRDRDALAALDMRLEERSYRAIAVFLYGEKAVRDDWTNPDRTMKNRVIRSVKRGFRMMNGGYRTLLR